MIPEGLTKKQIMGIIEDKTMSMQSDKHQIQIMNFIWGEIWKKSNDKGVAK